MRPQCFNTVYSISRYHKYVIISVWNKTADRLRWFSYLLVQYIRALDDFARKKHLKNIPVVRDHHQPPNTLREVFIGAMSQAAHEGQLTAFGEQYNKVGAVWQKAKWRRHVEPHSIQPILAIIRESDKGIFRAERGESATCTMHGCNYCSLWK